MKADGQAHAKNTGESGEFLMTRAVVFFLLAELLALTAGVGAAWAQADFKPHYASQRGAEANLREGPGYAYKVLWNYRHKGYPFQVIASFDIWRRVRDPEGTVGWMSAQMLTDNRTVLVTGKGRVPLHDKADPASKVVGLADPGAILNFKSCEATACRVSAQGTDGWIARDRIWGADDFSK
jgi:SH3-like domain-containing protein